jgi:hypothetical protein
VQQSFRAGRTLPLKFRQDQLYALYQFLIDHEQGLCNALKADGKCLGEAIMGDLSSLKNEIVETMVFSI